MIYNISYRSGILRLCLYSPLILYDMIQRKQTLFLIFSILILVGYIFSPVIRLEGAGGPTRDVWAYNITKNVGFPVIGHYFVFMCLDAAIVAIVMNLLTIFLFKYRRLQMLLCWLAIIPAVFAFCWVYYRWSTVEMHEDQIFYYGNISPWVAVLFMLMAWFYIKKDEELVQESNRLR